MSETSNSEVKDESECELKEKQKVNSNFISYEKNIVKIKKYGGLLNCFMKAKTITLILIKLLN